MNCIFCKIANGESPASVVYEDDDVLAFLDTSPATKKGHVLVIPRGHFTDMLDTPDEKLSAVFLAAKKVAAGLKKVADGVSVTVSNGKAAGQIIEHLHVHVVPRFNNDGLPMGRWEMNKFEGSEVEELHEKIKNLINNA